MGRGMRWIGVAGLLVTMLGCKGADGSDGAMGPQGPQGPQGPIGPAGSANVANLTGIAVTSAIDLALPTSATATNMPTFTCYISSAATGPWLVVPYSTSSGAPFCGVVVRADGVVEIRLRSWIVGYYYYVVAAWK